MGRRHARGAAIEARIRAANEAIRRAVAEVDPKAARLLIMCECAIDGCEVMLEIDPLEYDRIRSIPLRGIVTPEHVLGPASVVERTDEYWVVRRSSADG